MIWATSNRKPNSHWLKQEGYILILLMENPTGDWTLRFVSSGTLVHFSDIPLIMPCSVCWLYPQIDLPFWYTNDHCRFRLYISTLPIQGKRKCFIPSLPQWESWKSSWLYQFRWQAHPKSMTVAREESTIMDLSWSCPTPEASPQQNSQMVGGRVGGSMR